MEVQGNSLPRIGGELDGGVFAGVTTSFSGHVYALVLVAAQDCRAMNWADAMAWAKSINADLPTRLDASLLFANVRNHLSGHWVYISDADDHPGSTDWSRVFTDGWFSKYRNRASSGAYAVRRIPLSVSLQEAA